MEQWPPHASILDQLELVAVSRVEWSPVNFAYFQSGCGLFDWVDCLPVMDLNERCQEKEQKKP